MKFKIWFNGQDQNTNLDSDGFLEGQNLKNNGQVQILNFKNISSKFNYNGQVQF